MKLIRFNAPSHHRLVAFGQTIAGGQTVAMPDEHAAQLAADPHANVTVLATRAAAAERKQQTIPDDKEN